MEPYCPFDHDLVILDRIGTDLSDSSQPEQMKLTERDYQESFMHDSPYRNSIDNLQERSCQDHLPDIG